MRVYISVNCFFTACFIYNDKVAPYVTFQCIFVFLLCWGSVVVKALRYQSEGPGIDSRWFHWGFFSVVPPTEPCALRSTRPLKMSTRDFSWGKGGRCFWLTNYHPCSAKTSRKSCALIYPEPLGSPRPIAGDLTFNLAAVQSDVMLDQFNNNRSKLEISSR